MASVQCSIRSGGSVTTSAYSGTNNKVRLSITSVYYDTVTTNITANWSMTMVNSSGSKFNFIAAAGWVNGTEVNFTHPASDYTYYWSWSDWSDGTVIASGSTTFSYRTSFSIDVKGMFNYGWTTTRWNNNTGCVNADAVTCHISVPSVGNPSVSLSSPTKTTTTVSTTVTASAGTNGGNVSVSTSLNGRSQSGTGLKTWSGLYPHTTYTISSTATNSAGKTASTSTSVTTNTPSAPTYTVSFDSISRTSARMVIDITADPDNYWKIHYYSTSDSWLGATSKAVGTYSYTYSGLSPNTTYTVYTRVGATNAAGTADQDVQSRVARTFKTTGNNPSITSHGVQTYGQTTMTMKYSASYDTNDSLSSYKWDVGTSTSYGKTFNNTNSLTGLTANTTYYYRLTVTSSQGRSSTATGSFKTDYATQQVTSITSEDITETSVSGVVNIPNPTWLTNLTIWIYSGDTLINTITKTSGINASNSFLFEDLSPGTNYEIRARITTKTQNSSGAYNSNIKTLAVTTVDASPVHVIKSDGTDKKYKMYVMGKGNIYNPNVLTWQNGYYANGSIGQSISEVLTQSTEVNGGAASTSSFIEILPNIQYTITNNDIDVDFIIHGTDSSNKITTVGYTISPGQSYAYTGTPSTNRLWISIKSNTNPVINYATAKFFKLNIFRTIEKTLIPKDNIVYINGKIRYIDIVQAGSNHETDGTDSRIVALKVYDSAGNDIALNKTVTMIKGKNPADLQRITDGDITSTDYASISGKTSNDLETIVRVDLGKDYTDIDHVTLWRYYQDGRTYLNTKLYGRDATTRLTWKFHDFRIQGEYAETSTGYSSSISHEIIERVPVIISILQEPNNSTNTIVGTKLTINAEWLTSIPPVLNSWISYRTDAILAANQGRLLKNEIGNLSELSTTAKDSLVEAINEVWSNYLGSDEYTNVLNAVLNAILNR